MLSKQWRVTTTGSAKINVHQSELLSLKSINLFRSGGHCALLWWELRSGDCWWVFPAACQIRKRKFDTWVSKRECDPKRTEVKPLFTWLWNTNVLQAPRKEQKGQKIRRRRRWAHEQFHAKATRQNKVLSTCFLFCFSIQEIEDGSMEKPYARSPRTSSQSELPPSALGSGQCLWETCWNWGWSAGLMAECTTKPSSSSRFRHANESWRFWDAWFLSRLFSLGDSSANQSAEFLKQESSNWTTTRALQPGHTSATQLDWWSQAQTTGSAHPDQYNWTSGTSPVEVWLCYTNKVSTKNRWQPGVQNDEVRSRQCTITREASSAHLS